MDEIDFLKRLFKTIHKFFAVIFFIIAILILSIVFRENAKAEDNFIIIIYTISICGGIYILTIIMYFVIKAIFTNQMSIKYINNKDLDRTIITKYPPAIYSFLYNKKIESYSDYTATILNLECKNYLKINDDGSNIIILNDNLDDLYEHEKYVLNCLMTNEKFYMADFNKKIIKDLIQLNLIRKLDIKQKINSMPIIGNKYFQIFSAVLIVLLVLYLFIILTEMMMMICNITVMLFLIVYWVVDVLSMRSLIVNDGKINKYLLTKAGNAIRKNVFGLKTFLREYTLINERGIEQKELFENYIAYALSLGEAKAIEDFVSNNEKYRKFIYGGKILE